MKSAKTKSQTPSSAKSTVPARSKTRSEPKSTCVTLIAVVGVSPAILTETVWALAHPTDGTPPVIPDEILLLTTTRGKADLERNLFTALPEWNHQTVWQGLRHAILGKRADQDTRLEIKPIRVITINDPASGRARELDDIRTPHENAAAAELILDEVRRVTANDDTRLIASLAGGRKTMSALLYAAVSLLGRPTDRVTHVLVNEPFEQCPEFFYPNQPVQEVSTGATRARVRCRDARIDLAEILFVPLRNLFERQLARQPGGFRNLVAQCQQRVNDLTQAAVQLEIDATRTGMRVNGIAVPLSPLQHLLMLFLTERRRAGHPPIQKYSSAMEPLRLFAETHHEQRSPSNYSDWRHHARLPRDCDDQRLRKLLDEIRGKLRRAGPEAAALIHRLPTKGRFALDLDPSAIQLRL
jgi:CRISPR-associated protein (TIGR02584 family)